MHMSILHVFNVQQSGLNDYVVNLFFINFCCFLNKQLSSRFISMVTRL